MKRFATASLCLIAASALTVVGCKKDDPPPNSANNMQQGYGQPGYGQPGYGQPGYTQPTQPGYTQPQPTAQPTTQPAGTAPNFMGIPLPFPGMGGGQTGGGTSGGGQEVGNNPTMGMAAAPILTPLQQQHAGMNSRQVGETLAGNLSAGQYIKAPVQLQPGKCYTGIGQGAQPVKVELVAQVGDAPMATSQPDLISVLGSGQNCFKNPFPIAAPAYFRVVAQGSGPVSAALYEK